MILNVINDNIDFVKRFWQKRILANDLCQNVFEDAGGLFFGSVKSYAQISLQLSVNKVCWKKNITWKAMEQTTCLLLKKESVWNHRRMGTKYSIDFLCSVMSLNSSSYWAVLAQVPSKCWINGGAGLATLALGRTREEFILCFFLRYPDDIIFKIFIKLTLQVLMQSKTQDIAIWLTKISLFIQTFGKHS